MPAPARLRHMRPNSRRSRRAAIGRVESNCGPDSAPETCHSWALRDKNFECAGKGGLWPGRAKAEFKLAAVNQSSKAGRREKF